jgi:hypothetical protein
MKKSKKPTRKSLTSEERALLVSFERDEWKTVTGVKKEKERARKTAEKTLRSAGHLAL